MKILFWMSSGFDRQITSGHLLSAIIEALCESGHSVHIIQKDTGGELPAVPDALSEYGVTTKTIPFQSARKSNFLARFCKELEYLNNCKPYLNSDYDAVFIQSTTVAGVAAKIIKHYIPKAVVTLNVQDVFPYNLAFSGKINKNGFVFNMLARLQRRAYDIVDNIITISDDMRGLLIEDGTDPGKIQVVYNWSYQDDIYMGLDLSPVSSLFDKDRFHVVYAGNIGLMQNVELLIDAAVLMRDDASVLFHVIGDGVNKPALMKKVENLALKNVLFTPMQSASLAPLIYSSADVNVITLKKDIYRTALPSKTATCLACGKPIVFAIGRNGSFAEEVYRETGCPVTDSDDAKELVAAITMIRANQINVSMDTYFRNHFGITKNSMEYAAIITQKYSAIKSTV